MSDPDPLRLLVIEDQPDDFKLAELHLKRYFRAMDIRRVSRERDLREALNEKWDAVLCDLNLPGFSWKVAMGLVRMSQPKTPFIIFSGSIEEQLALDLLRNGADDYLSKNDLERLGWVIHRAIFENEILRKNQEAAQRVMKRLE